MGFTIIGSGISPLVRKVMVYMIEKGLPHEIEDVNPFSAPPDFAEVSPLGTRRSSSGAAVGKRWVDFG